MTPALFVGVALAGGLGAAARLAVDAVVRARVRHRFPVGTAVVNVSGSFLLGLVVGLGLALVLAPEWQLVLGTGLLGGFTTFSTASVETVRLVRERHYGLALVNGVGVLVVAVAAGALGLWAGAALGGSAG